jgi:hypothetical protein
MNLSKSSKSAEASSVSITNDVSMLAGIDGSFIKYRASAVLSDIHSKQLSVTYKNLSLG